MLDICLLGTGGMMPMPRRALTALMLRLNGSSLLIDCGEGTQVTIREKGWSVHPIDTICFTHYHGDHISGLPGLLLSMGNSARTEPVTMIGPKGLEKVVNALRTIAPSLPFEIIYHEISERTEDIECNGYRIRAFRVNHNVTCYGYSVFVPRQGKFMPEKAQENQVPMRCWNLLQKGEEVDYEGVRYTPDMILGEPRKGIHLTYCTDTRPTELIAEEAKGADLFICEGMYGEDGMDAKAVENKHMTFAEAALIAKTAEVKEMWLTHYSPSLIRPEEFMPKVREVFSQAKAGKDRMSMTLEFDKNS